MNTAKLALENEYTLSPHARFLKEHGMYSAALFYKNLNETIERRGARAIRYRLEEADVPNYVEGQSLFVHHNDHIYSDVKDDDHFHKGAANYKSMLLTQKPYVMLWNILKNIVT